MIAKLFNPIKEIFFLKGNFKLFQKFEIFIFKRFASMMLFLVHYVIIYLVYLGMSIRKYTIAILPGEFSSNSILFINEI